jgi:thymidylate synthase (FAD)
MVQVLGIGFQVEDDLAVYAADIPRRIEKIARTCYKSEGKIEPGSAERLLVKLIERGHEAMLEHAILTVRCTCDRGVSHELVRHRIASYAQESTRYCNYAQDKFGHEISVVPMMTGLTEAQIERRHLLWKHIEDVYMAEIEEKVPPEQARDNLPTCLKTEIVVTLNLREWRHFFTLRTAKTAHPQMRKLAIALLDYFRDELRVAVVFDDIQPKEAICCRCSRLVPRPMEQWSRRYTCPECYYAAATRPLSVPS